MIKIYLINLDRSPQRLVFMQSRLKALGLEAERVAAVDGAALDPALYAAANLGAGEMGCFLSHRTIWERLVNSPDDYALVLEDDARLSSALVALLSDTRWIPASAELIKLDTSGRLVGMTRSASAAPGNRRVHRLNTEHTGAAGYIISRDYAITLMDRFPVARDAVDITLFGADAVANSNHHVFQMVPAAIAQEKRFHKVPPAGFESILRQERRAKRISLPRRLIREGFRPFRHAVDLVVRRYRWAFEDVRYQRVPFAED